MCIRDRSKEGPGRLLRGSRQRLRSDIFIPLAFHPVSYTHIDVYKRQLAALMTDNVVRTSREVTIGKTFIKRLEPCESVKYIVAKDKDNDDFSNNIIVEKVSYVSKIIGFNVPESFE